MIKRDALPQDVRAIIRKKLILRLSVFLLLETLSAFLLLKISASEALGDLFVISLIVLPIYPLFASRLHLTIKDRPYFGEITEVNVIDETGVYKSLKNLVYYPKQSIVLSIRLSTGKNKSVKVKSVSQRSHVGFEAPLEGKIADHISDYSVGDTVYHFSGLDHLLIAPREPKDFSLCVVCGTKNSIERDTCLNCGHSCVHKL